MCKIVKYANMIASDDYLKYFITDIDGLIMCLMDIILIDCSFLWPSDLIS